MVRCEIEKTPGPSFLDVWNGDYFLTIEWRPSHGFALVAGREAVYGEGPDEIYSDFDTAAGRVVWLLENRGATSPPTKENGLPVLRPGIAQTTPLWSRST